MLERKCEDRCCLECVANTFGWTLDMCGLFEKFVVWTTQCADKKGSHGYKNKEDFSRYENVKHNLEYLEALVWV